MDDFEDLQLASVYPVEPQETSMVQLFFILF
jgi:hypothetical protein